MRNTFSTRIALSAVLAVALSACGNGQMAINNGVGAAGRNEASFHPGSRVHVMRKFDANALTNTATATNLLYYGGPVIANVKVVAVNWGSGVNSTVQSQMPAFYSAFTQSPMFDWLNEYNTNITAQNGSQGTNQIIGHGTFSQTVTISPSVTSSSVSDTQIQSEISSQITSGSLPAPDADTIYMINFPKGITITQGGSSSCVAFCAYHGTFTRSGQNVYYGVLPSIEAGTGCDTGCGGAATMIDNQTSVASHELIEAVTDAAVGLASSYGPPLAWYDPDPNTGEIGDICNAQQGSFTDGSGHVWTVQKEWSNQAQSCIDHKTTTTPGNDFSVSLSPASASVAAGASTSVTITTAVTSGSAESIALSVSGLPAGVTGSFSPASVTSGQTSTLTLTAASTASAATATYTVTGTATTGTHTTSGSLSVTTSGGGGGGGGVTVMSNGVAISNLSGATGAQSFFSLDVPAGATNLTFTIAGGSGDADMYVKFGSQPTLTSYDCRPYVTGNNETCTISTIQTGTYYVMLNGYAAYSGVTLTGSYSTSGGGGGGGGGVTAMSNGVPISSLSGATGSQTFFSLDVPSGASNLTFTISGGSGDADMYVKFGSQPSLSSYDCRPYVTGNNETCTISTIQAGTYYVMLNGYAAYSGVTLTGSYSTSGGGGGGGGGGNALTNGVPVTGISGATGSDTYFTMDVPAGSTSLTFSISGGTGDADLYVRFGADPTLSTYDCRPYLYGNSETCTISNIQAGTYHVMINGYQAYSGVSLVGQYQ